MGHGSLSGDSPDHQDRGLDRLSQLWPIVTPGDHHVAPVGLGHPTLASQQEGVRHMNKGTGTARVRSRLSHSEVQGLPQPPNAELEFTVPPTARLVVLGCS